MSSACSFFSEGIIRSSIQEFVFIFPSIRSISNIFNHLLCCLCSADILLLVSNCLVLPVHFGYRNIVIDYCYPIIESFCHFGYSASIFFIISITIERWQVGIIDLFLRLGPSISRSIGPKWELEESSRPTRFFSSGWGWQLSETHFTLISISRICAVILF